VHVEVAEENSIALVGGRPFLAGGPRYDVLRRERHPGDLAVELVVGASVDQPKSQHPQDKAKNDRKTTLFPPSHAARSIGRDNRLSKRLTDYRRNRTKSPVTMRAPSPSWARWVGSAKYAGPQLG
jgi:hypothetical protein